MKRIPRLSKNRLHDILINTRQMTSLIDREIALAANEVKRETVNWVPMWVDWNHAVRSDCNSATALRAITDHGELLWYVRHDSKKHGYHSLADCPFTAFDEAMQAWRMRKLVRGQWPQVRNLSRDLITGRKTLVVTVQDADQSALCSLGIKWFCDRLHISRKTALSGRTAALLMKIEPQLGFVIYEAAQRSGVWTREAADTVSNDAVPALSSGE